MGCDYNPDIFKSFEISEIIKDPNQSAIVENSKDISFLVNGEKKHELQFFKENDYNNINKDNIGQKPGKLSGEQARLMEKFFNKKRIEEIVPVIVQKPQALEVNQRLNTEDSEPKLIFKEENQNSFLDTTKITKPFTSNFSGPKIPANSRKSENVVVSESEIKEMLMDQQRKTIEDMINQGNSIFNIMKAIRDPQNEDKAALLGEVPISPSDISIKCHLEETPKAKKYIKEVDPFAIRKGWNYYENTKMKI